MLELLINLIYDKYLKKTGRGEQFDVPVTNHDKGTTHTIRVWAKSAHEAEMRAIDKAFMHERNGTLKPDKTLGLLQGKDFYKPKSVKQAITSPIAVWRDPIYKNAVAGLTNNAGYKSGTMLKGAVHELKDVLKKRASPDGNLSIQDLKKYEKNSLVTVFIWLGMLPIGLVFLYSGITMPDYTGSFFHINQQIVAGVVLTALGVLGFISTVLDYKKIQIKISEAESGSQ